jgi:hypothetical protein
VKQFFILFLFLISSDLFAFNRQAQQGIIDNKPFYFEEIPLDQLKTFHCSYSDNQDGNIVWGKQGFRPITTISLSIGSSDYSLLKIESPTFYYDFDFDGVAPACDLRNASGNITLTYQNQKGQEVIIRYNLTMANTDDRKISFVINNNLFTGNIESRY